MVDLSSCYFCGAAMDASLHEQPVVPAALAPTADEQETVVLCGTCQRKLDRVLAPVVDVIGRHATGGAAARDATAVTHADPGSATDDDGDDDDPDAPADRVDDAGADDGTRPDAGRDDVDDHAPFEFDDTASVFDGTSGDDDDADGESIFSDGTTTIVDDTPSDHGAGDLGDGITIDEADSAGTNGDSSDAASTGADGRSGGDTGEADGDSTPPVDPRTYNKVVRLLKNRDLPVARGEIEAVAGSAYDIPDRECETIVDAAIERGLVAERDGDLVHPDGV